MSEDKKPAGRPRVIKSPEQFDELVNKYIADCQNADNPKAITLTGMILSLGLTSKEGFYEYQNYDGFSDSVKRARLIVECEYENRLVVGTNAAAPIFALKNFGWADKQDINLGNIDDKPFQTISSVTNDPNVAAQMYADLMKAK